MKFIIYCCCSVTKWCQLFVTPWTAAYQAFLSITNSWSLLKLMSIELVMPSNHLIFCHPLLLLPSIFLRIRVFSTELAVCIRWPKDWHISFSTSTSNEYSGLISFRADLFDLLALHYCLIQNSGGSGSSLMPHKVDFYPCCPPHKTPTFRGHHMTATGPGATFTPKTGKEVLLTCLVFSARPQYTYPLVHWPQLALRPMTWPQRGWGTNVWCFQAP